MLLVMGAENEKASRKPKAHIGSFTPTTLIRHKTGIARQSSGDKSPRHSFFVDAR